MSWKSYDAHNALSYVHNLRELYESNCESSDIFTTNYHSVRSPLAPMVQSNVIFTLISISLIACYLSLNKLKIIYRRDPHSGNQSVLVR
jgi:hypothetical protein